MELIKSVARRSKVSDVVYIVLNIALAGLLLALTVLFQPPIVAYALVLLSKWRVFAVCPRFWWANLQTNMVDMLVGISVVTLIWQSTGIFLVQLALAALYATWLLILKPRSSRKYMVIQAGVSQFLGITALFSAAHLVDSALIVIGCFVIGYLVARHVFTAYEEDDPTFLSIVWGFLIAELGWASYHWVMAYDITPTLLLPMVSIIAALFGFVGVRFFDAKFHDEPLRKRLQAPVLFTIAVLAVLLIRELSVLFNYTS
jgi:hypothetical protein